MSISKKLDAFGSRLGLEKPTKPKPAAPAPDKPKNPQLEALLARSPALFRARDLKSPSSGRPQPRPPEHPRSRLSASARAPTAKLAAQPPFKVFSATYAPNYRHGSYQLGNLNLSLPTWAMLFPGQAPAKRSELLFVDTETTGLSGGVGTCPFLIGLGFFDGNGAYHTRQFFLNHYGGEELMLKTMLAMIAARSFRYLVSFNGKTFDLPLIRNRLLLNRVRSSLPDMPHLDLLFPARRLFKGCYEDCRLGTLETKLFGIWRQDDIPGHLIPEAYFEFTRTGRFDQMNQVLYHNQMDVITMVALLGQMLELKSHRSDRSVADFNLGRLLLTTGQQAHGQKLLIGVLQANIAPAEIFYKSTKILAAFFRRQAQIRPALQLWQKLGWHLPEALPEATIEQAKLLEHRLQRYEEAIALLHKCPMPDDYSAAVAHRLERLHRKLARKNKS